MNARLYDPRIGRFLSPDNYITDPENPQSYNRYSYALNNPLSYVDPSGNVVLGIFGNGGQTEAALESMVASAWLNNDYGLDRSIGCIEKASVELWICIFHTLDGYFDFGSKYSKLEEFATNSLQASLIGISYMAWAANEIFFLTGGKLPEDAKINGNYTPEEEQLLQDGYDEDKKDYEEVCPDYGVPIDTEVIIATGKDIAANSDNFKNYSYLVGLAKWNKHEIWLNSELMLGNVIDEYHEYADGTAAKFYYNSLEVLTHEVGHFQGYIWYADYKDWSDVQQENQAIRYTNYIRSYYKRRKQIEYP